MEIESLNKSRESGSRFMKVRLLSLRKDFLQCRDLFSLSATWFF